VLLRSVSSEGLTCSQRNEISVLEMLHHPNIVSYHGSFVEDGVLNIIMDFADGVIFACMVRADSMSRIVRRRFTSSHSKGEGEAIFRAANL